MFLGGLTGLALFPVWLPWVALPVAERFGANVADYDRKGYGGLDLRGVTFTNAIIDFTAEELTLAPPSRWLSDETTSPRIQLANWRLDVGKSPDSSADDAPTPAVDILDQTDRALGEVSRIVKHADATNGVVQFADQSLVVRSARLKNGVFAATLDATNRIPAMQVTLEHRAATSFSLDATADEWETGVQAGLHNSADNWDFDGRLTWRTNALSFDGRLAGTNVLPTVARAGFTNLVVAGANLGLPETLAGRFDGELVWTNRAYAFSLTGESLASPAAESPSDGALLNLAGRGDLQSITIDEFQADLPFLRAELSNPLTVGYTGSLEDLPRSEFQMAGDLAALERPELDGQWTGQVVVEPDDANGVRASFSLNADNLLAVGRRLNAVTLEGEFEDDLLTVDNASLRIEDALQFTASGSAWPREGVLTNVNWRIEGDLPVGLLSDDVSANGLLAEGGAEGPWSSPGHRGTATIEEMTSGEWRFDAIAFDWAGELLRLERFDFAASTGELRVEAAGEAAYDVDENGGIASGRLNELSVDAGDGEPLILANPAAWSVRPPDAGGNLTASVESVRLVSESGERVFTLHGKTVWPRSGEVGVTATNLPLQSLKSLPLPPMPVEALRELDGAIRWDEGPVELRLFADSEWRLRDGLGVTLRANISNDAQGVHFDPVTVREDGAELFHIDGLLPLQLTFGTTNGVVSGTDAGAMRLELRVNADSPLWGFLTRGVGVRADNPSLELNANGSAADLNARLRFAADRFEVVNTNVIPFRPPPATSIELQAVADGDGVRLEESRFLVNDQPVELAGELPFEARTWEDWVTFLREPDLMTASARVAVTDAEIEAFADLLPDTIAPVGRASARLSLEAGAALSGNLSVTNAATAPIQPVGAIHDIAAAIRFGDAEANVDFATAVIAGQPVYLSGRAGLASLQRPELDFQLTGTNVSLVREPEVFLRGDLDVRLTSDTNGVPVIGGTVTLRDSLFFQDLRSLVAINLNRPETRPPFFSVQTPPVNAWKLDLRLVGDRFLRVLSPLMRGELSSDLRLSGTLAEPRAVGAITVDGGSVLFPFGTLTIEGGRVSLTQRDPFRPQLDIRASGLNYGYDIRLEVSGTADAPRVTFQSTPSLQSRQILLMLTAGEIPQTGSGFSYSNEDKASRLGFFLGKEFLNQLFLYDDTEERLIVRTGENVTDSGQLTYSAEYKLDDRWSVIGEYNRFRDFNGGLKFKVYSK